MYALVLTAPLRRHTGSSSSSRPTATTANRFFPHGQLWSRCTNTWPSRPTFTLPESTAFPKEVSGRWANMWSALKAFL